MKKCKNCGEELKDEAKFCPKCGCEIIPDTITQTQFCANCGHKIPENTRFCPECGNPKDGKVKTTNTNADKSPGLAAILSFFIIGLGQIYLGLTKKGILLFLAAMISGVLMLLVIGWITWLIVWAYAIYDAYNSGEKIRNGIEVPDTIDFNNLF